ncbi:MAG: hypothetical protein NTV24_02150 [Candidatus Woesebacteria bacterium]|nr:hypothetical protein [Candidatus Woesebacteria bacterium]
MESLIIQSVYRTEADEIKTEEAGYLKDCADSLSLVKYVMRKGNRTAANYLIRHAAKCLTRAFNVRGEREI